MRKKLLALLCTAALALSMPAMAMAAPNWSAQNPTIPSYADGSYWAYPTITETDNGMNGKVELVGKDGEVLRSFDVTVEGVDNLAVQPTTQIAKNFSKKMQDDPEFAKRIAKIDSFEINAEGYNKGDLVTVVYYAGKEFAGNGCYVFVEHSDGTTDWQYLGVDGDGNVTFTMDNLSIVTMGMTDEAYSPEYVNTNSGIDAAGGSAAVAQNAIDNSKISPVTGSAL